ncbi:hypothetical protein GCK72_011418 [Caenorhabditis remanei]|uniref:DUF38 domain-containing protein n=1 Tax=Caenorhabditis remanei TaxID=31234 RepID=A0A6A5H9S3_CAERE|nr:hypothetical protein GCK72_011418 [Caenorhabditis remanei]KAF1763152.1 hypothetical protein GCK72_011418 [Caenorhabditis remanei]
MPLAYNQEVINGILFTFHFQKELPFFAHQKLIEITGVEVMSQEQVTEFFKMIDNGEFRLQKEVENVTLAQVLNVPNFVEKYLDIETRLRLRKTCTTIRETLNEKPLFIDCLKYKCNINCIEISTNEGFKVSYEITEGGLNVKNGEKVNLINATNEEKVEIIQRDLMSIFGSEKLRIDTFEIENYKKHVEAQFGSIALRNTLNEVPNKLKIRNLKYGVEEVNEVLIETLKTIDPESLKFLRLFVLQFAYFWTPVVDLYNLQQWKCLKSLKVFYRVLVISDIIRFYTHVDNAHLEIDGFYSYSNYTPLHTSIMMIKDKLLQNPNLKQFKMEACFGMMNRAFENVKASLQQYNTNNAPHPCWISIPYPNSDKKLEILVDKMIIWFKGPCYVEGDEFEQ